MMASATDFLALFMLQIVIAGNGIPVRDVDFGERDIITGFSNHLDSKSLIK